MAYLPLLRQALGGPEPGGYLGPPLPPPVLPPGGFHFAPGATLDASQVRDVRGLTTPLRVHAPLPPRLPAPLPLPIDAPNLPGWLLHHFGHHPAQPRLLRPDEMDPRYRPGPPRVPAVVVRPPSAMLDRRLGAY